MTKIRIAAGAGEPRPAEVPTIKIEVSGGVVSNVESTGPAIIEIWDFDNLREEEGEDDCAPVLYRFG